jgi:hypothetical protein
MRRSSGIMWKRVILAAILVALARGGRGGSPPSPPPSIEALLDRLLHALEARDVEALHRLRVTESEYRTFFLPGSVKEGQPLQIFPDRESEFFWQFMNTKSVYTAQALLQNFGGHAYRLKDVKYRKGHRTYALFEAWGDPVLTLETDDGHKAEMEIGSIVNVRGQYKFMAFNSD